MRSVIVRLVIIGLLCVSAESAMAADGSSGCGPGWYVFNKNSLVSSSLRNTTNGFLAIVVTFGMTFGTSNCSKHSIVLRDKEVERFLAYNYSSFQHDGAKGNGDYVSAVANMYNCNFIGADKFNSAVQENYGYLYDGEESAYNLTAKLNDVVHLDSTLSTHCSVI